MTVHYAIAFIQDNCVQCHACEVACKSWRDVELGIRWRRVEHLWRGSYPLVKNLSASVACMHCIEPACVEACPEGAIVKRAEDGIVVIDIDNARAAGPALKCVPLAPPNSGWTGKCKSVICVLMK